MPHIISAILLVYLKIKSKLSAETRKREKSLTGYIMLDDTDSSAREGNVLLEHASVPQVQDD